jgi:hypothetical protein
MRTKKDPTTSQASSKPNPHASLGTIGSNRTRLSPTTEHERPMIVEDVGEGVVLIEPYLPPTKRFLYFLMALVGEVLRPRRRVNDPRR